MDEELFGQETDLEDAIDAFMKSTPEDDDDDVDLSDEVDADPEADDAEEPEVEETDDEDDEELEDPEEDTDDTDEDGDDEDEDEGEEPDVASDDAVVVIPVDGKDIQVSVKDLKRLHGQEASLTQKAQALSSQKRTVEAQGAYIAQILQSRYEAAKAVAEKYKDVDLFRASRELEAEEFDALRAAKENAESELQALEQEGQTFLKRSMETRATILREQAKESLKVITEQIPEWSDQVYADVRTYAVSQGMDADMVNDVVDAGAIIMMHKAMQFDKAQAESKAAKEKVVRKVAKAPKKVVRKSSQKTDPKTSKLKAKREAVMNGGGDIDDVTALFEAAQAE